MSPRIVSIPDKILLGKRLVMSHLNNRTFELWSGFMPHRRLIAHPVSADLYSVQVFDFITFNPEAQFDKWAAVEVADTQRIPEGMEVLLVPGGLYAVFDYKGLPSASFSFFQAIFHNWLPNSQYELDQRPHFAVMGSKYKNGDPESEEEIWVPVRLVS